MQGPPQGSLGGGQGGGPPLGGPAPGQGAGDLRGLQGPPQGLLGPGGLQAGGGVTTSQAYNASGSMGFSSGKS